MDKPFTPDLKRFITNMAGSTAFWTFLSWMALEPAGLPAPPNAKSNSGLPTAALSSNVDETVLEYSKSLEEKRAQARNDIDLAKSRMKMRDYEAAVQLYQRAFDNLPLAKNAQFERDAALEGFRDASLELARIRIGEGRYTPRPNQQVASAEELIKGVISRDPQNKAANRLLAQLETPGFFNKTITPAFRAEIEDVKKWLLEAQGFYDTGRFDLAIKRTDQVLAVDPYNSAARKLQEIINAAVNSYAENAYNESRSRALKNVQKAWASPIKKYTQTSFGTQGSQATELSKQEKLTRKIRELKLGEVEYVDTPLFQIAVDLAERANKVDKSPGDQPITIIVSRSAGGGMGQATSGAAPGTSVQDLGAPGGEELASKKVTIPRLPSLGLDQILKLITDQVQAKYVTRENFIEIVPASVKTDVTTSRSWTVSPFIFTSTAPKVDDLSSTSGVGSLLGASSDAPKTGKSKVDAKAFLKENGVKFDAADATATYNSRTKTLTVINTPDQLDLVAGIVDDSEGVNPVQVDIQAKFVEFTQSNFDELSFDWLLGQSNFPGSRSTFLGGGTPGSSRPPINPADYPFGIPRDSIYPNPGQPVGVFPVTGGNRSGGMALSSNAIDSLLMGGGPSGAGAAGAAAFSIAGAFTDPQFQLVIRAMKQSKGVDLLSSPSITAQDNQEATIEITREFRYPSEFTPPTVPQIGAGPAAGAGAGAAAPSQSIPVAPSTPSAWATKNTGVTLKVTPKIMGDNYAVSLDLEPEVVEFEGFINYGSPIKSVTMSSALSLAGVAVNQTPTSVTITDNVINQPIFAVRKVRTNVTILDGETITLGGLIREDVQKVNDRTPILGDIPLIGRLFRSNVNQQIKKNLTIFVSARIIDATGQPVKPSHSETEPPEEVPSLTTQDLGFGN
jgi:general secretion pathway protein D